MKKCHRHLVWMGNGGNCASEDIKVIWIKMSERSCWTIFYLCILLVLAVAYGFIFLQCLHIIRFLFVTLSPFIVSTGNPKYCHTNDLKLAGESFMLISTSGRLLFCFCYGLISQDSFSLQQEIQSCINLAKSCDIRSHQPTVTKDLFYGQTIIIVFINIIFFNIFPI